MRPLAALEEGKSEPIEKPGYHLLQNLEDLVEGCRYGRTFGPTSGWLGVRDARPKYRCLELRRSAVSYAANPPRRRTGVGNVFSRHTEY